MKNIRRFGILAATLACLGCMQLQQASAAKLLLDFAINSGEAAGFDAIERLVQDVPYALTDQSGGGDDDVTITAIDDGFNPNNPAPPNQSFVYDGITVPQEAVNDYLFKIADQAGTTARMRIDNLDAGLYNVTLFEGRTSDSNQVAKLWVGDDAGSGQPAAANTTSFAGGSTMLTLDISAGDVLWYQHLEDGSGGISGMLVNPVPEPSTLVLASLAIFGLLFQAIRRR